MTGKMMAPEMISDDDLDRANGGWDFKNAWPAKATVYTYETTADQTAVNARTANPEVRR